MARLLVKSLLTLNNLRGSTQLVLEQFEIKPILDKARTANQAMVEKHGYSKYVKEVDFFELMS